MLWNLIQEMLPRASGNRPQDEGALLSRRRALLGIGSAGVALLAAPALLASQEAEAAEVVEPTTPVDDDLQLATHDRRRGRSGRRRYGRRELQRRCRRDRRFRRRNRQLCRRVAGMRRGRRGSCVWIGPVAICD